MFMIKLFFVTNNIFVIMSRIIEPPAGYSESLQVSYPMFFSAQFFLLLLFYEIKSKLLDKKSKL